MPFLVEAAAGESLLAAEVAAPAFDAAAFEGLTAADVLGTGAASGLGSLGGLTNLYGGAAQIPSAGGLLSSVSPEATAQINDVIANAAPGANQIQYPLGSSAERQALFGNTEGAYGLQGYDNRFTPLTKPSDGGLMDAIKNVGSKVGQWWDEKTPTEKIMYGGAGLLGAAKLLGNQPGLKEQTPYSGPLSKFKYDPSQYTPYTPTPPTPYTPVYRDYRRYAGGGPIEAMSNANAVGANTGYPMADINKGAYATPWQTPISRSVLSDSADTGVNPMTGEMTNFAGGGIADLGAYSDGGRMLKGPGDGMSDNIPATIAGKQPARLANEEFVVPADVVSHLGNGSSDAGAKQLYKMMDRVRQARTGTKKQGKQINPDKYLPT